jgi:hypothetical protein
VTAVVEIEMEGGAVAASADSNNDAAVVIGFQPAALARPVLRGVRDDHAVLDPRAALRDDVAAVRPAWTS